MNFRKTVADFLGRNEKESAEGAIEELTDVLGKSRGDFRDARERLRIKLNVANRERKSLETRSAYASDEIGERTLRQGIEAKDWEIKQLSDRLKKVSEIESGIGIGIQNLLLIKDDQKLKARLGTDWEGKIHTIRTESNGQVVGETLGHILDEVQEMVEEGKATYDAEWFTEEVKEKVRT